MIHDAERLPIRSLVAVAGLCVLSVALRTASPSDIFDDDQASPMSHMVDVAVNGNWLLQKNTMGLPNAKPPMFPWIGGLSVGLFGPATEWSFKLPVLVAFIVTGLVVFDLTRRVAPSATAWLAVGIWVANYHSFKLMFTARTDMLLTMWIALAVWSVQRQRDLWRTTESARGGDGYRAVALVLLFAACLGAGFLTKGPAAILPLPWLVGCVAVDRAWLRCRPILQCAGLLVAFGLFLAWLLPAMKIEPYWRENMRVEWVDRVAGGGSGAHRSTSPLAVPAYFLARFAPWSLLFVVATVGWRRWRYRGRPAPIWPIAWVLLVIGVYMIPGGKRADYIMPAYVSAAMLVALFLQVAAEERGWPRFAVHLVLGTTAIGALGFAIVAPWVGQPGPLTFDGGSTPSLARPAPYIVMVVGMVVAIAAAVITLLWTHRRRYFAAAWACAFALVGVLGIYQSTMSRAGRMRSGDAMAIVAARVRSLADETGLPVTCRQFHTAEVRALLGVNRRGEPSEALVPPVSGFLVTTARDWEDLTERYPGDHTLLLVTPPINVESARLVVGRFVSSTP